MTPEHRPQAALFSSCCSRRSQCHSDRGVLAQVAQADNGRRSSPVLLALASSPGLPQLDGVHPAVLLLSDLAVLQPVPQPVLPHPAVPVNILGYDPLDVARIDEVRESRVGGVQLGVLCAAPAAERALGDLSHPHSEEVRVHLQSVARRRALPAAIGEDSGGARRLHVSEQGLLVVDVDIRVDPDHPVVVVEPAVAEGRVHGLKRAPLVPRVGAVVYLQEPVGRPRHPALHLLLVEEGRVLVDDDVRLLKHRELGHHLVPAAEEGHVLLGAVRGDEEHYAAQLSGDGGTAVFQNGWHQPGSPRVLRS
mmetsp:Transcript_87581/g.283557  ORF Transcript_87581/g.283557 Transcript_87581/m.283557 type:complete len:307 (+) Transcript_87581:195-1115(+)